MVLMAEKKKWQRDLALKEKYRFIWLQMMIILPKFVSAFNVLAGLFFTASASRVCQKSFPLVKIQSSSILGRQQFSPEKHNFSVSQSVQSLLHYPQTCCFIIVLNLCWDLGPIHLQYVQNKCFLVPTLFLHQTLEALNSWTTIVAQEIHLKF